MKKILLILFIVLIQVSCSVDPIEDELQITKQLDVTTEIIGCAGPDKSTILTRSEASNQESWDEVRKIYVNLLPAGVSTKGTFNPSIWEIIHQFNEENLAFFTTEYSLDEGECLDTVLLTIQVIEDPINTPPCEPVDAGPDNLIEIEQNVATNIESWDEVRKLYLGLLATGVSRAGTFNPSIKSIITAFQSQPLQDFSTVYTIGEGECTDSVILTVKVIKDKDSDPICNGVTAGPDNSITLTRSVAANIESWDEVRKLYLTLLAQGISRQGTFDPSIWELIRNFQNNPIGEFTTTYTIIEGDCSDSVQLTIKVIED
ncbi:hypothetical protein [Gillisia sp. Hel_I_29]|uniref:hypothetical protein n=1 Tax=Gillisia sp. Hel_I_29 TaxID=1249975 RepID=UPI00054DF8C8|nr:hypothetical protein [Gillisia sp. Hel_I_29]